MQLAILIGLISLAVGLAVAGFRWLGRGKSPSLKPKAYKRQHSGSKYTGPLIEAGLLESEINDCMIWAFGHGWRTMVISQCPDRWNEEHSDLFIMSSADLWGPTLYRIGVLYLESKS